VDPTVLGTRIREARERLGMSQEDFAVAVAKDQRAISEYERGKRKLPVTDLPTFAEVLGVPVLYFYEGELTHHDLDLVLLDEIRRLPTPEAKQAVIQIIRVLASTTGLFRQESN